MNKQEINAVLEKHGITIESVFVPWSRSRNAGEKNPSLNWKVTLKRGDKKILTTDYRAGMGHCPAYKKIKNPMRQTWEEKELIKYECEIGRVAGYYGNALSAVMSPTNPKKRGDILPDSADVIYSLLIDSEVLEFSSFEDWAGEFGYNADSRSDEKIYTACMKIALQFHKIGESVIAELREVFQDY